MLKGSLELRAYREDPVRMVRDLFRVEPDPWQAEILRVFPRNPRLAMKASKGVGKTTILAWLCWNFLLTRPHPNIGATSITGKNLDDGLWKEMAKWLDQSEALKASFTWTKQRIFANDYPATWFMAAKAWAQSADKEQQANALAGFHADYIMFVLDEAGGIPDAVMAAAEAALSTCVEGHLVLAGNPTHLSGPLYRASVLERADWYVVEISGAPNDPNRSQRVSREWAEKQIRAYGQDNPWVLVNVFGQFPPSSINSLIGPDEVSDAMKRVYHEGDIHNSPRVLGVDVAREGDDKSVIFPRQGLQLFNPTRRRNIDGIQGAGIVARKWNDWNVDACFVDNTGGYGSSWVDNLLLLGKSPIAVNFSSQAHQLGRYYNKRTEMYFDAVEWIKKGGALPPEESNELLAALTQTTYSFKGDRMILEPKDVVKAKLGYSPDDADAFALTFAEPVLRKETRPARQPRSMADYNPFREMDDLARSVRDSYDPWKS